MKLVVAFFLFLCFYLFGGYDSAKASNHICKPAYAITQNIKKTQQVENSQANQGLIITKISGLTEENPYLVSIDDEDEEDSINKHILLATYFLILSFVFISGFKGRRNTVCIPFLKHLTYIGYNRYISLRTIRI